MFQPPAHTERSHPYLAGHGDVACSRSNNDHVTLANQISDTFRVPVSSRGGQHLLGEFYLRTVRDTLN
jgi:hypothetical protein